MTSSQSMDLVHFWKPCGVLRVGRYLSYCIAHSCVCSLLCACSEALGLAIDKYSM